MKWITKLYIVFIMLSLFVFSFSTSASAATITVPTVSTSSITNIGTTYATISGVATANGGANITEYGIYYGTSNSSMTKLRADSSINKNTTFAYKLSGLSSGTKYYVKTYMKNSAGTGYGSVLTFTTTSAAKTLTSISANVRNLSVNVGGIITNAGTIVLTAKYSDGSTAVVTNDATWKISDNTIANLPGNGTIKGIKAGSTTLTLTYGGKSTTIVITVLTRKYDTAKIVANAKSYLGTPYLYGGDSHSGIDCSHLVWRAYDCLYSYMTASYWSTHLNKPPIGFTKVTTPQAGDVVIFSGHMGVMIDSAQFIHAPHTGDVVKISKISGYSPLGYYRFN